MAKFLLFLVYATFTGVFQAYLVLHLVANNGCGNLSGHNFWLFFVVVMLGHALAYAVLNIFGIISVHLDGCDQSEAA